MTRTEIEKLTTEEIDALYQTEPVTIPCPTCKGASQMSNTAPHCDTCEDYGCFSNPRNPGNWEH